MPRRGARGDPGLGDQPHPRAVIPVRAVPLPGGERAQDRGPGRRLDRIDLLEGLQAPGLDLGRHRRRVGGGQVGHRGRQHVQRLRRAGKRRGGTHLILTSVRMPAGPVVVIGRCV